VNLDPMTIGIGEDCMASAGDVPGATDHRAACLNQSGYQLIDGSHLESKASASRWRLAGGERIDLEHEATDHRDVVARTGAVYLTPHQQSHGRAKVTRAFNIRRTEHNEIHSCGGANTESSQPWRLSLVALNPPANCSNRPNPYSFRAAVRVGVGSVP